MKSWQIVFLIALFMLHMIDLGSTVYGLSSLTYLVEMNPVFEWINNARTLENFALFSTLKIALALGIVGVFSLAFNQLNKNEFRLPRYIKLLSLSILSTGMIGSAMMILIVDIRNILLILL